MNDGAILSTLEKVLKTYAEYYGAEATDCSIKKHPSGIVAILIKGEEVEWFFNEYEFLDWVRNQ